MLFPVKETRIQGNAKLATASLSNTKIGFNVYIKIMNCKNQEIVIQ